MAKEVWPPAPLMMRGPMDSAAICPAKSTLTALLIVARRTFVRFPLLPLGYAMMPSWATLVLWFPCLVAWLVKKVLLRLYGYRGYLAARPFFIGMIVGEVVVTVVWTLVSVLLRLQPPYMPLG